MATSMAPAAFIPVDLDELEAREAARAQQRMLPDGSIMGQLPSMQTESAQEGLRAALYPAPTYVTPRGMSVVAGGYLPTNQSTGTYAYVPTDTDPNVYPPILPDGSVMGQLPAMDTESVQESLRAALYPSVVSPTRDYMIPGSMSRSPDVYTPPPSQSGSEDNPTVLPESVVTAKAIDPTPSRTAPVAKATTPARPQTTLVTPSGYAAPIGNLSMENGSYYSDGRSLTTPRMNTLGVLALSKDLGISPDKLLAAVDEGDVRSMQDSDVWRTTFGEVLERTNDPAAAVQAANLSIANTQGGQRAWVRAALPQTMDAATVSSELAALPTLLNPKSSERYRGVPSIQAMPIGQDPKRPGNVIMALPGGTYTSVKNDEDMILKTMGPGVKGATELQKQINTDRQVGAQEVQAAANAQMNYLRGLGYASGMSPYSSRYKSSSSSSSSNPASGMSTQQKQWLEILNSPISPEQRRVVTELLNRSFEVQAQSMGAQISPVAPKVEMK